MLTATFARITAIFLITVCAASCGGGGGGGSGAVTTTPPGVAIPAGATTPTTPPSATTASLWLGNVSTLGASATVSQSAPTSFYDASVITNATVATTYYIRGSYTKTGIASIQASVANGTIAFTITFKSPAPRSQPFRPSPRRSACCSTSCARARRWASIG